jgi:hypothetical protein
MSTTYEDVAWDEYCDELAWEAQHKELIEDALKEISRDGIGSYLHLYGDAIETRIKDCLESARDLHKRKYYGSSIVCSCTAVEVTIRYFILSALMQGMFLHDEWAAVLTRRIVSGRAAKDREMLPSILKFWKIDINNIKLPSGGSLWQDLHGRIWEARNKYVHRGDPVPEELSALAAEAATRMVKLASEVLLKALGYEKPILPWACDGDGISPFS